ncbi:MAG: type II toxin-antitoxin system Phd/YefM family antitoxin [Solirubrobacterales bacterium]|nr:type II toxin-antitoxin system Phd/YefM family antitoxin [Solirubrobacterales bacterium]MCB8970251.1 type II toxin-antitoxin system Phd/YefM family antitoxin [Thermoleophilales bacterium]MCO5327845.1 type II toxin-antitoxin system Phd/YefM family antitoxin [Solirubrobacterales bacterium]
MKRITATEASRSFAELLDAVDRSGDAYVIERRGRPVATIGPPPTANGGAIRLAIEELALDRDLAEDLGSIRSLLVEDERPWHA